VIQLPSLPVLVVPLWSVSSDPTPAGPIPSGQWPQVFSAPRRFKWYPGISPRPERQLHKQLAKVDLVIEVREPAFPPRHRHPRLQRWMQGKQRLLVITAATCQRKRPARLGPLGCAARARPLGGANPAGTA